MIGHDDERFIEYQTNKIVDAIKSLKEPAPELPDYVETNLNLYIKVKLNDYGKKIHHDYWRDICRVTHIPYKLEIDEEGYSLFHSSFTSLCIFLENILILELGRSWKPIMFLLRGEKNNAY